MPLALHILIKSALLIVYQIKYKLWLLSLYLRQINEKFHLIIEQN